MADYLDENGNPIKSSNPVYLDENGNPQGAPAQSQSDSGQKKTGFFANLDSRLGKSDFENSTIRGKIGSALEGAGDVFIGTAMHPWEAIKGAAKFSTNAGRIAGVIPSSPEQYQNAQQNLGAQVGSFVKDPYYGTGQLVGNYALGEATAPVVGKVLGAAGDAPRVIGDVAKNKSYKLYNNVLGTKGRNMAFGSNPGRGVAAEGVWGGKESLLNGIEDAIAQRGQQKTQVLNLPQNAIKRQDYAPAVSDPFVEALNNGVRGTTSDATLGRLRQTLGELTSERQLTPEGVEYGGRKNLNLSPAEADKLKTDIYERTKYNNPDLDESVNNTLRQSGHGVKAAIESQVPEVTPFNQRLSDLYGAQNSLGKIINNRMVAPTRSGFTEVAPAVVGSIAGGPVGAATAVATREMARMPAIRTATAQGLYRFGRMLSPEEALRVPDPQAAWLNTPTPKALPAGPVMVGPSTAQQPTAPPPIAPTTRAQRLGLLLPEKAGGQIELPSSTLRQPIEAPSAAPTTRAQRLNLLLPEKGTGKTPIGATQPGSELWNKLQKNGEQPFAETPQGAITSTKDITDKYKAQGVDSYLTERRNGTIELSKVVVPKDQRGSGIGTAFMNDLVHYADENGKTIALTPSKDFGATSVSRLKGFYKRFGFVENKGRGRDLTISEDMIRKPQNGGR